MNKYIYISAADPKAKEWEGKEAEFSKEGKKWNKEKLSYIRLDLTIPFVLENYRYKYMRVPNPDYKEEFKVGQLLIDYETNSMYCYCGYSNYSSHLPTLEEARKMLPQFNIEEK